MVLAGRWLRSSARFGFMHRLKPDLPAYDSGRGAGGTSCVDRLLGWGVDVRLRSSHSMRFFASISAAILFAAIWLGIIASVLTLLDSTGMDAGNIPDFVYRATAATVIAMAVWAACLAMPSFNTDGQRHMAKPGATAASFQIAIVLLKRSVLNQNAPARRRMCVRLPAATATGLECVARWNANAVSLRSILSDGQPGFAL